MSDMPSCALSYSCPVSSYSLQPDMPCAPIPKVESCPEGRGQADRLLVSICSRQSSRDGHFIQSSSINEKSVALTFDLIPRQS